jgi:hypothetical protein
MQQYIKIYYSIFIWNSTCFGRHSAHHQEPKTALAASGLHTWKVVGRVVAGRCQAEPETCLASYKYGIINFDTLLHLVGNILYELKHTNKWKRNTQNIHISTSSKKFKILQHVSIVENITNKQVSWWDYDNCKFYSHKITLYFVTYISKKIWNKKYRDHWDLYCCNLTFRINSGSFWKAMKLHFSFIKK